MDNLPLISSVFLSVTDACNLRCPYCFVEQQPHYMEYRVAKDTVDFLIRNAEESNMIPAINFFGGEPTLCWDSIIVPLTRYIRSEYRKPFDLSMTTNGTLLDEKKIQFMVDNQINILFSIDGDKETQNANRPLQSGKGSFPLVEKNVDRIVNAFPNVCFRSTVTPKSCRNVFHNVQFACQHGYKNTFLMPNVFERWTEDDLKSLSSEMRKLSDWLISLFRDGKEPPIRFSDLDESFKKIQMINTAITKGIYRDENHCGACAKCGLGSMRFAAIDYLGNAYACQELVSPKAGKDHFFYIGSIYDGISDEKRQHLIQAFQREADRTGDCQNCRLSRICNGGCVANNFMVTGDINKTPSMYCWWMNLLLDEAIYIARTLGSEQNEAFTRYWKGVLDGGRF